MFLNFDTFEPNSVTRRPLNVPNPSVSSPLRTKLAGYLVKHAGLHPRLLELHEDPLVFQVLEAMDARDFALADSLYLKLSIGSSAWPIGGINLGIVQQSERKVANNPAVEERLTNESVTELRRLINLERIT